MSIAIVGRTLYDRSGRWPRPDDDVGSTYDSRVPITVGPGEVITVVTTSYCPVTMAECGFPGYGTYELHVQVR